MHEHGQRLSVTEKKIKLIINKDMKIITTTFKSGSWPFISNGSSYFKFLRVLFSRI